MGINERNLGSILTILLALILVSSQLKGQTIKIKDLNKGVTKVNVFHDVNHDILNISTSHDTIHIKDCIAVENTNYLNEHFAKIIYLVRGGAGIHIKHMVILTSRNGRLCQSLHVTSLFREQFINYSKKPASSSPDISTLYEIHIKNIYGIRGKAKVTVSIHVMEKSSYNPENNYNKISDVTLSFDVVKNVFYTDNTEVSQYFSVYNPKTQQESKQHIAGRFPSIKLGKYYYYCIKGEWYEKSDGINLLLYSYK